jgi:hypothetical protein
MSIVLVIILVMVFDWGLGSIIAYFRKREEKRNIELLEFKVNNILKDKTLPLKESIEFAKAECRMVEGKYATGMYMALDAIANNLDK